MTVPSYPAPGYPPPEARPRPTVVTVAVYLLFTVAAVQALNAVLTFSIAGAITDAVRDAYAGTEADGFESIVTIAFVGGAVINLLLGAGFVVLGILDGRGKNAARIVTWVIGGIALCCFGVGLGGTAMVSSLDTTGGGSTTGVPSDAELQRQLDAAQPSWFEPITTTLSVVALLAILGAVILLALPAANDFFRKRVAGGWDPTAPPYPGAPGYPGQPGYPATPYPGSSYPSYPGQPSPGPSYPGQPSPGPSHPGQPSPGPSYPGQQGQPGQPAPGLPPYPGQGSTPPADPYAAPPTNEPNPPKPPTDPV